MTEQLDHEDDVSPDEAERPDPTGVARVDAVMDAVAEARDLPAAEQVAVFERAHSELRSTLDDPGVDGVDPVDPT